MLESGRETFEGQYDYDGYRPDRRRIKRSTRSKVYRIGQLWDVHHEIVRRTALGERGVDIAKQLNISKMMVSYTINSKIAKDRISILRGAMDADTVDLGKRIREIAPKALKLLDEVISGKGAGSDAHIALRTKSAENMLDRAGYGAVKKVMGLHAHLSPEDIERIKARAKATMSPMVVSDPDIQTLVGAEKC